MGPRLHNMIQFICTRIFPTARRLSRILAMPNRFLHRCKAFRWDVPESMQNIMLECSRWECPRRNFGTIAPKFQDFLRQFTICTLCEDITTLLLGGVPPPLHDAFVLLRMRGKLLAKCKSCWNATYVQSWRHTLSHIIAFLAIHVSHCLNVLLREMGLGPSRITRMAQRPYR
jgi:hypothetical protein